MADPAGRHTATEGVESDLAVSRVWAVLSDPARIPEWAPAFADSVSDDAASGWEATKDGRTFALRVVANRDAGTVDVLRQIAPGRDGGAYIRVVPRPGGGSVVTMTLPFVPDVDPAETARLLSSELAGLLALAGDDHG